MCSARYPTVAIIGGGAAGLAACKGLALEPVSFATIDLFERKDRLGGLWYSQGESKPKNVRPQVPSDHSNAVERWDPPVSTNAISPVYKHLETNLISSVMEYSGVHFDEDIPVFPSRQQVHDYLIKYSKTVPDSVNIRLNTEVVQVDKKGGKWVIDHRDVSCGSYGGTAQSTYDALIICNGHFDVGKIPDIDGLQEWDVNIPGSITHAKYYDDPEHHLGARVLIVGNLSSGSDIASQIANSASHVYVSTLGEPSEIDRAKPITFLPEIVKYDYRTRSVTTADHQVISDIDSVVFCTGYLFSMPFMDKVLPDLLAKDGSTVNDLFLQMFYIPDPSLVLIGLPADIVPMPLCESQAAVVARYFSGRLELPLKQDMERSRRQDLIENGTGRKIHVLTTPKDVQYIYKLQAWIDKEGLRSPGLIAPIWDDQRLIDRQNTRIYKGRRIQEVLDHAEELRSQGEPFSLPPQKELYR